MACISFIRIVSLMLLTVVALASGCRHTLNVTNIPIPPGFDHPGGGGGGNNGTPVSISSFSISKPGGGDIHAGDTLNVNVAFGGDIAPFALGYVFNGNCVDPASVPAMPRQVGSSPDAFSVTVLGTAAAGVCTVDVGIADADGNIDTASTSFTIVATGGGGGGGPVNHDPTITVAGDDATCSVLVTVADSDGDDVSITQSVPAAMTPLDTDTNVTGGNGSVTFHYAPTDILAGASGTISYTVDDGNGGTATLGGNLFCAGVVLEPDTLYAIPTRDTVNVGSPLTMIVATGDPANPFEYMNGVRITCDATSGFDYVGHSFNVGALGGAADDVDGFWAAMSGIANGDFLLAPDSFYNVQDAGAGLSALDFNITPLGGANIDNGSGALFNFQATFTTAGTYVFGFQEFNIVDRTFYNDDSQGTIYHWGDVTNTHAGVKNSVTVTP